MIVNTPEGPMVGVIDSSGWQFKYDKSGRLKPGALPPDFALAAKRGVVGIIHRIGNGTSLDHSFNLMYPSAKHHLKVGAYYYAQPGRMTAAESAALVLNWLKEYDLDLPIMLDLEAYYGEPLTRQHLGAWVNEFLSLVSGPYEDGEGQEAILYAGTSFANVRTITEVSGWDTMQPRYYKNGVQPPVSVTDWPGFVNWDKQPRFTVVLGQWEGYQFSSDGYAPAYGFPRDAATKRLDLNLVHAAVWDSWVETPATPTPPAPTPPTVTPTKEYEMKQVTPRRVLDERNDGSPRKLHAAKVVGMPFSATVAQVNIVAVPDGKAGHASDRVGTSFLNYGPFGPVNVVLDMPIQPDGSIIFGTSSNVHAVVDLRGLG